MKTTVDSNSGDPGEAKRKSQTTRASAKAKGFSNNKLITSNSSAVSSSEESIKEDPKPKHKGGNSITVAESSKPNKKLKK